MDQLSDIRSKSSEEAAERQILRWKSHPLSENSLKTAALFGVLGVVLCAIYFAFDNFVFLAAVVLFLSLIKYFLPTRYQADSRGISIFFLGTNKFRPWSSFGNIYVHSTGVHLAPFERPSALDSFRGIFLLFGRGDKDEIIQFVTKNIQQNRDSQTTEVGD